MNAMPRTVRILRRRRTRAGRSFLPYRSPAQVTALYDAWFFDYPLPPNH